MTMPAPSLHDLWQQLLTRNPSCEDLLLLLHECPSLRKEAWRQLRTQHPGIEHLLDVLEDFDELRGEAAREILGRHPHRDDLVLVAEFAPELREDIDVLLAVADERDALLLAICGQTVAVEPSPVDRTARPA